MPLESAATNSQTATGANATVELPVSNCSAFSSHWPSSPAWRRPSAPPRGRDSPATTLNLDGNTLVYFLPRGAM